MRQDCEILMLAVNAATSKDATLRSLVEKHGADWRQFDHEWAEAENQRFIRDFPALAAAFGKHVTNKAQLVAAARSHIRKKSDPWSIKVHELRNVVHHGVTAVGESIETRTCIERHQDAQGHETRQIPRTVQVRSRLWFRQIDGQWYIATENETTVSK